MTLIAALFGYATLVLIGWRVEKALTCRWDRDRSAKAVESARSLEIGERETTVKERDISLREREFEARPKVAESVKMPREINDWILSWEDGFAQEDARRFVNEKYTELGNWEDVMRILPRPEPIVEQVPRAVA